MKDNRQAIIRLIQQLSKEQLRIVYVFLCHLTKRKT